MTKPKYLAGEYELIREELRHVSGRCGDWEVKSMNESIKLDLTSAQAKMLMTDNFYDKLGFSSIELIQDSPPICPQCGHYRNMILDSNSKWICHGTHRR